MQSNKPDGKGKLLLSGFMVCGFKCVCVCVVATTKFKSYSRATRFYFPFFFFNLVVDVLVLKSCRNYCASFQPLECVIIAVRQIHVVQ
jgi:hypothetical protein